jgi:uncharacterized membrane protein YraQ (UPF0718 family)
MKIHEFYIFLAIVVAVLIGFCLALYDLESKDAEMTYEIQTSSGEVFETVGRPHISTHRVRFIDASTGFERIIFDPKEISRKN